MLQCAELQYNTDKVVRCVINKMASSVSVAVGDAGLKDYVAGGNEHVPAAKEHSYNSYNKARDLLRTKR
jgi:hypothetical protein